MRSPAHENSRSQFGRDNVKRPAFGWHRARLDVEFDLRLGRFENNSAAKKENGTMSGDAA